MRLPLLLATFACLLSAVQPQRLAVTIQTFSRNHHMVESGRNSWRHSITAVVCTNGTTERRLASPAENEVWWEAPDQPEIGWNNPSENRYTAQIRFANMSAQFEWLLSGDDDTIWLIDNVIDMVRDLDPADLYYFTDALNDDGVACTLREEASERGPGNCVVSPPATPCYRSVVEDPSVCRSEKTKRVQGRAFEEPGGTIWGFGQVGFITSRGLVDSISTADITSCEFCNSTDFCHQNVKECHGSQCYGGGDVRLGNCFWYFAGNRKGIAPTVPYSHAGVHVFGHAISDIIAHAERVIEGQHCDETCHFVLDRVLSTDIHHASPEEYAHLTKRFSATYAHAKRLLHGEHASHIIAAEATPAAEAAAAGAAATQPAAPADAGTQALAANTELNAAQNATNIAV